MIAAATVRRVADGPACAAREMAQGVVGISSVVYALVWCELAMLSLNWQEMMMRWIRLIGLVRPAAASQPVGSSQAKPVSPSVNELCGGCV